MSNEFSQNAAPPADPHGLADGILYGPVSSRRFGATWGINLLPARKKFCSFNCVYCQLGWNDGGYKPSPQEFPSAQDVTDALNAAQNDATWGIAPGALVVSGNGEPTLNPFFAEIAAAIHDFRATHTPKTSTICFSAGTALCAPEIQKALALFDECAIKWDANLKKIDLAPSSFSIESLIEQVAALPNLVLQCCFVGGKPTNADEASVSRWADSLARLNPKRIDIYTVARDPAAASVAPISPDELESIARRARQTASCPVRIAT